MHCVLASRYGGAARPVNPAQFAANPTVVRLHGTTQRKAAPCKASRTARGAISRPRHRRIHRLGGWRRSRGLPRRRLVQRSVRARTEAGAGGCNGTCSSSTDSRQPSLCGLSILGCASASGRDVCRTGTRALFGCRAATSELESLAHTPDVRKSNVGDYTRERGVRSLAISPPSVCSVPSPTPYFTSPADAPLGPQRFGTRRSISRR